MRSFDSEPKFVIVWLTNSMMQGLYSNLIICLYETRRFITMLHSEIVQFHLNIILLYNHASTNRILFVFHKNFLISFFYSIRDMCAYIYIPLCNSSYAHTKTPSEKCKLWSFSLHNFLFSSFSLNDIPEHVVLKRPEVFIFRDRKYSKWYWHFHCTVN